MMIKEMMPKVIVVVTAVAVTVDMVMIIATVITRVIIVKTTIANTAAMIGVNPLVKEKMKTKGFIMKSMMMM